VTSTLPSWSFFRLSASASDLFLLSCCIVFQDSFIYSNIIEEGILPLDWKWEERSKEDLSVLTWEEEKSISHPSFPNLRPLPQRGTHSPVEESFLVPLPQTEKETCSQEEERKPLSTFWKREGESVLEREGCLIVHLSSVKKEEKEEGGEVEDEGWEEGWEEDGGVDMTFRFCFFTLLPPEFFLGEKKFSEKIK
jgi:hypothetical protein